MSATISWSPVKPGKSLPVNAPSSFREAMEEAFGIFPITLTEESLSILKGMRSVDKNERETYDEILEAIEKHGEILLEISY